MPLRYTRTGAALPAHLPIETTPWSTRRCFHSSPRARRLETNTPSTSNHYETLNVHPTATPAEIKKYLTLFSPPYRLAQHSPTLAE